MVDAPKKDVLRETHQIYKKEDIYRNTPIVDDRLSYYVPNSMPFADDDDYVSVELRHQNRPYVLSYDLYGSDALWWLIVEFNKDQLFDPIRDLVQGMVLRVPTKTRVAARFPI